MLRHFGFLPLFTFVLATACGGGDDGGGGGKGGGGGASGSGGKGGTGGGACTSSNDGDCDGHDAVDAGGGDCDDSDASISPDGAETPSDGIDQNCDGVDGVDADGDGHASTSSGGDDCDNSNPDVAPGKPDQAGDGVDQNCDGTDGIDADSDGHASEASGGDDCDDADANAWGGKNDNVGDGEDENCDGIDGEDADADGHASKASGGTDCNDGDKNIYVGASDDPSNCIDENCDGKGGQDEDQDGLLAVSCGGPDCNDTNEDVQPGANDNEWTIVDIPNLPAGYPALAAAQDGSIGAISLSKPNLVYAHRTSGGTWSYESISKLVYTERYGFVFDSTSAPHVAYIESGKLWHATRSGGSWVKVEIEPGDTLTDDDPDLALGPGDELYVAWREKVSGKTTSALRFARKSGGSWIAENPNADVTVSSAVRVILGPTLQPEIVFGSSPPSIARRQSNATWTLSSAPNNASLAFAATSSERFIAVHSSGNLEVHRDGTGAWVGQVIETTLVKSFNTSLLVEPNGTAHLAYFRGLTNNKEQLWYATNVSGKWRGTIIDVGSLGDVWLDTTRTADGKLHVIYNRGASGMQLVSQGAAADGVDQNCDGIDGVDADDDNYASKTSGGADCNDLDKASYPNAPDALGDGIDQDCDGSDG